MRDFSIGFSDFFDLPLKPFTAPAHYGMADQKDFFQKRKFFIHFFGNKLSGFFAGNHCPRPASGELLTQSFSMQERKNNRAR